MKLKRYFYALLALLFGVTLVACNNPTTGGNEEEEWVVPDKPMQVFVGTESVVYYQDVLDQYVEENDLPFTIEVTGVDTG